MEKTLTTGRVVQVRKLNALDEIFAYQVLGDKYNEKNVLGSAMLHRALLAMLSIEKIDGEDFVPPQSDKEVFNVLKAFDRAEWKEVEDLYDEVNGDAKADLPKSTT